MSFLDSSVIIDYLEGIDDVVSFVDAEDTLLTSTVCVYEVLEGEVFAPGPTDVFGRRQDFGRVQAGVLRTGCARSGPTAGRTPR